MNGEGTDRATLLLLLLQTLQKIVLYKDAEKMERVSRRGSRIGPQRSAQTPIAVGAFLYFVVEAELEGPAEFSAASLRANGCLVTRQGLFVCLLRHHGK